MADGDEIHANLPRRYLNSYRDLCAPGFDAEDVAHDVARVVRNDLKDFGNPPIRFIVSCMETLTSQLPEQPLLRQAVDYSSIYRQIDRMARQNPGNEAGMDLAKRAVRSEVEAYRQGSVAPTLEGTLTIYQTKIHDARFSERVPLTTGHLEGLSVAEVSHRLAAIRPYSQIEYAHISRSIARNPTVDRRIQRRRYDQGLGLYDEVR